MTDNDIEIKFIQDEYKQDIYNIYICRHDKTEIEVKAGNIFKNKNQYFVAFNDCVLSLSSKELEIINSFINKLNNNRILNGMKFEKNKIDEKSFYWAVFNIRRYLIGRIYTKDEFTPQERDYNGNSTIITKDELKTIIEFMETVL